MPSAAGRIPARGVHDALHHRTSSSGSREQFRLLLAWRRRPKQDPLQIACLHEHDADAGKSARNGKAMRGPPAGDEAHAVWCEVHKIVAPAKGRTTEMSKVAARGTRRR